MYASTFTQNGKTTVYPEKAIGKKMVIELRKHTKYWKLPFCSIRHLLFTYEKVIKKIPDLKEYSEIEKTDEYKKVDKIFNKIVKKLEKKTGEDVM